MPGLTITIALLSSFVANDLLAQTTQEIDRWAAVRPAIARGEALFQAANYGAALAEYNSAYVLLAGYPRRYTVLNNIAACHERLFQYDLAIAFYERYLNEGGEAVEDRVQIDARLRSLDQLLATLTIASNVPADVWIDDRKAGRAPGAIRVSPGSHVIELRAALHEPGRREAKLATGSSVRLVFELEKLSQYSGLGPGYFWTFAGLTVAALGVGAGFGVATLQADAVGEARALENRYLNTQKDEDDVKRLARVADTAFIGAAVLGVSTAVLFFLTHWGEQADEHDRSLEPHASADGAEWELGVRGAF